MKKKALSGLKIVDADKGAVEAVFSTLNVVDSDKDVTRPGAFEDGAPVRISAYNHASWNPGMLPVGKGTIHATDTEAILRGEFFLDTAAGKDTFSVVKQMGELQEWSYGYDIVKAEPGTFEGEDVQFLDAVKVHEVSPVILGAGVDTRTLTAKGKQLASDLSRNLDEAGNERFGGDRIYVYVDDFDIDAGWVVYSVSSSNDYRFMRGSYTRDAQGAVTLAEDFAEVERTTDYRPKGRRLSDHLVDVRDAVEEVTNRFADAVAQRAEKGQKLSSSTLELAGQLESATQRLGKALATEPPTNHAHLDLDLALAHEQARFRRNH